MTIHKKAKDRIKSIKSVKEFYDLLDSAVLSDEERQIMVLHYLDKKSLAFIADELGFSESCIKKKHHKILCLLDALMDD